MRTEGDLIEINKWLTPLSLVYGLGVGLRNRMYELGIKKSRSFAIPVISLGNITVGGAGKTPHTEYLVRLLKERLKVAVLSRGYKRKTKGYVLADDDSTVEDIGDEPRQMKSKFPDIYVAVDANRCEGIDRLTEDEATKDVDVILLDDAYQHRHVKPGINILLVDYHRLIIYDRLLPAGRLREPEKGKERADMVIITKCPRDLKPMEFRVLTKVMNLRPYQDLFFTTIDYDTLVPILDTQQGKAAVGKDDNVLLLTGIASPKQMEQDISPMCKSLTALTFADHHRFRQRDIEKINEAFLNIPEPRIVVTTEKDAARLQAVDGLSDSVRQSIYALPVKIKFMLGQEETFKNKILSYVQKNSRNSILVKTKDDIKPKDSNNTGERPRRISFRDN
ncbi:MAG: tetraacyldisaccharide 4'-kinase [Prevotella sp.]|nr:tetraacyldisaccharide 4'-kinase [Prevotella sp.]